VSEVYPKSTSTLPFGTDSMCVSGVKLTSNQCSWDGRRSRCVFIMLHCHKYRELWWRYHDIVISPYHHIITSSCHHIIISSYHRIVSVDHAIIVMLSCDHSIPSYHIIIRSAHAIISSYHNVIISYYDIVTYSPLGRLIGSLLI